MIEETTHRFNKLPSFNPDGEVETEDIPIDDDDEEYGGYDEDEDEPEDETEELPDEVKILEFNDIVDIDDTAPEPFYVKEWGGSVVIKGITKTEFNQLRRVSNSKQNRGRSSSVIEREVLMAGMVKPRLDAARYQILMEKSSGAILRLTNKILEKSGLADEAEKRREQRFPRKR